MSETEINYKQLLRGVIDTYENDFMALDIKCKDVWNNWYLKLIKSLARITLDFRYCSKKDCPCCPEYEITELMSGLKGNELDILIPYFPLSDVSGKWIKDSLLKFKRKEIN